MNKQLELIKRCIDEGFVEVGMINSVNPRTAESLVVAEILEYDYPPDCENELLTFVRIWTPPSDFFDTLAQQ